MRGVNNTCGNSGGVERGVIAVFTKWKFRGEGGAYMKFPLCWRYGYFLELHINLIYV